MAQDEVLKPLVREAIQEVLPEAPWQRCYVHFLGNALDPLPRKADDDCMTGLRGIYDRRTIEEAHQDRMPRQHHKNLKSTNMLERLMEEIKNGGR